MRVYLSFALLLMFSQDLSGQINGYFVELGGSYMQRAENIVHREFSFRNSAGLLIGRNWAVGMKFHQIFYHNSINGTENMRILGPFGRWGFRGEKVRLYWETGINWGNYRAFSGFSPGESFKESGLLYVSFGPMMEARIREGLFFEIGISAHEIINRPFPSNGFDSILIGLLLDLKRGK